MAFFLHKENSQICVVQRLKCIRNLRVKKMLIFHNINEYKWITNAQIKDMDVVSELSKQLQAFHAASIRFAGIHLG